MSISYLTLLAALILAISSLPCTLAKLTSSRMNFRKQDWLYITKFGTPPTGKVNVNMRAQFVLPYRKTDEKVDL